LLPLTPRRRRAIKMASIVFYAFVLKSFFGYPHFFSHFLEQLRAYIALCSAKGSGWQDLPLSPALNGAAGSGWPLTRPTYDCFFIPLAFEPSDIKNSSQTSQANQHNTKQPPTLYSDTSTFFTILIFIAISLLLFFCFTLYSSFPLTLLSSRFESANSILLFTIIFHTPCLFSLSLLRAIPSGSAFPGVFFLTSSLN
jgi:hypothetical protein